MNVSSTSDAVLNFFDDFIRVLRHDFILYRNSDSCLSNSICINITRQTIDVTE